MKTRFRAALLATICALVVFGIGGMLPVWMVEVRPKPAYSTKVWQAPRELFATGKYRLRNVLQAGVLASVLVMVWLVVNHTAGPNQRPDAIGDYEEIGDAAMPDGRGEAQR